MYIHTHTHEHTRRCRSAFSRYDQHAIQGSDEWGKQFFHNTPFSDDAPYYAGLVTPVIHYCMGGLAISADGRYMYYVYIVMFCCIPPDRQDD